MDLELAGKAFLVTGGTDGLGAALADRLVAEGAAVAVCGRDEARIASTQARLLAAGGDAVAVAADVTSLDDLTRFVAAAAGRFGRIDGIVNNAGQASGGAFEDTTDEMWQADIDLKVMAAVRLSRLALPHLRAAGGGSIVNVLNVGSKAPGPRSLPTTASRAAGLAITKALSKELGPESIRVNAVLVGIVESGQWRRRAEASGQALDEVHRQMAAGIPLGRIGRADEFGDLVAYLLSARASYVTGSAINLDGGSSPVL
jgi:NAD(P)-dependent dehydrogenase (short-subunit alcohol dehydrogenase family)